MAKTSLGLGNQALVYGQNTRANLEAGQKALNELFGLQQNETQLSETKKQNEFDNAFKLKSLAQDLEIANLKKGGSLSSLSVTAKKGLKDNLSALKDLKAMKDQFGQYKGGIVKDMFSSITGPISGSILPEYGKNGPLRTALSKLEANIRKDAYGSAFTETERKSSDFIPSPKKSETQNLQNLDNQINSQVNKIKASLSLEGYSDDEIQSFIDSELGSSEPDLGGEDVNNDPLGLGL
jgi:hypothetical protein